MEGVYGKDRIFTFHLGMTSVIMYMVQRVNLFHYHTHGL